MKLAGGSYTLVEQSAPEGYVLDATPIPFTVDAYGRRGHPAYRDRGRRAAERRDRGLQDRRCRRRGGPRRGVYEVRAAADVATPEGTVRAKAGDVVDTLVTGEDGPGVSPSSSTSAPTRSRRSPCPRAGRSTTRPIAWRSTAYAGQEVAVASAHLGVTDQPTTVSIEKKSSLDGAALPGAEFTLSPAGSSSDSWDAQAIPGAMASALGADVAVEDLGEHRLSANPSTSTATSPCGSRPRWAACRAATRRSWTTAEPSLCSAPTTA